MLVWVAIAIGGLFGLFILVALAVIVLDEYEERRQ